jgi:serpin B
MADFGAWLRRLFGHPQEPAPVSPPPRDQSPTNGPQRFADDNNRFALAMYGQLRQQQGNVSFSPFSIRTALSMTQAGATGETAVQMREALRTSCSDARLHVAFAEIIQELNTTGGGEYEMAVANSLWGQDGAPLRTEFLDLIARHYGGGMHLVDFRRDAEAARVSINSWVDDKTRQKIRELIPVGGLDAVSGLILVNAVYFKGMWVRPFDRVATRDAPFDVAGGRTVQVPLMRKVDTIRYVRGADYQAVDLIYRGDGVSLFVLLPNRKDGLAALEKSLSVQMIHDCSRQMAARPVDVFLPRFTITWGPANLRDHLITLGMPLAFNPLKANFSVINGHEPPDVEALFLSAVWHKTFVEVHEEGTEAAAATAVGQPTMAARPPAPDPMPIFRADHPFLFAIRDRKSGAILFLGRVVDPTLER